MQVKKLLFTIHLFLLFIGIGNAAVTSLDNTFVANDQYSSDFYSRLNRNFTQVLNGGVNSINNANIVDDSLTEAEFADEINPRVRTYEGAACEYVYTGLLPVTGGSLTQNTSAGTAYPRGFRINKASATAHSYTASKWTWVDIDQNGDFQYSEQAIGSATPSVATNSIRLARVSTDGTTVFSVLDLRKTSCTNGPFSIISDAAGEATLGDILKYPGWANGLNITTKDSHSVYINPGAAYINGEYRVSVGQTTVDGAIVASPLNGTSGIDTGSLAANTNYYIYGVADLEATSSITGVLSTSSSTPSGATNYRRLGEASTDASATFSSSDVVSVSYLGKYLQDKKAQFSSLKTGTGIIPSDDTKPENTEGDTYMSLYFTPVSASSALDISGVFNYSENGTEKVPVCLFRDSEQFALGCSSNEIGTNNYLGNTAFEFSIPSHGTTQAFYYIKAGSTTGATITFNGFSGARKYGGVQYSSLNIKERTK